MPKIKCECGHEFEYSATHDVASMVFCDPPYRLDYHGGMNALGKNIREGIANDNMSVDDFYKFMLAFLKLSMIYCEGCFYICMSSMELANLRRAFDEAGGHWQDYIIWAKHHFTLSPKDWQSQYEPILYGWNGKIKKHYFAGWRNEGNVWDEFETVPVKYFPPTADKGEKTIIDIGDYHLELEGEVRSAKAVNLKDKTDLWEIKKPARNTYHPNAKPLQLCTKAISSSSRRGEIVFDPFLGGGSTLFAAQRASRICYGIEMDPRFVFAIIQQVRELFSDLPILRNGEIYTTV